MFCSFPGNARLGLQLGGAALDEVLKLPDHLAPGGAARGLEARMDACGQVEAEPLARLGGRGDSGAAATAAGCRSCPAPFLSKASISSAVGCLGFGAAANVFLDMAQDFIG